MRIIRIVIILALVFPAIASAQDKYFSICPWAYCPPHSPDWNGEKNTLLDLGVNEIEGLSPTGYAVSGETLTVRKICDATNGEIKATVWVAPNYCIGGSSLWDNYIRGWNNGLPYNWQDIIKQHLHDIKNMYSGRQVLGSMVMGHEWVGNPCPWSQAQWTNILKAVNFACAFWQDSLGLPDDVRLNCIYIMPINAFTTAVPNITLKYFIDKLDSLGTYEHDYYPFDPNILQTYNLYDADFFVFQERLNKVVQMNDSCFYYFEDPVTKGIRKTKWTAIIQASSDDQGKRWPTREEIRCQAWLALSRGAKGMKYFCHFSSGRYHGLVDGNRVPRDTHNPSYPSDPPIYDWVKELNTDLRTLGPTLAELTGHYAFGVNTRYGPYSIPANCYVKAIGASDANYAFYNYFEAGCFKDPSNNDYFMLVNRYCQPADTVDLNLSLNYPVDAGRPNSYFIEDVLTNQPITGMLAAGQNQNITVKLLPGGGRLLRIVPFASAPKLNHGSVYTNFKFAQLSPEVNTEYTKDSIQIVQKYWVSAIHDTMKSLGFWQTSNSGWLPYTDSLVQPLASSEENKANIFELQYKLDGGKVITPTYTTQIIFNDVSPNSGSVVINNGASYTNNPNISLRIGGNDAYPGLSRMRYADTPFGNPPGYVNLIKNGTFNDTTNWTLGNAVFENGYLHLLGCYHGAVTPWEDSSVAIQIVPGSDLVSWQGKLLRLTEEMYMNNAVAAGKAVSLVYDDTLTPWGHSLCNRFINNGEFNSSCWDTFTIPVSTRSEHLEIRYWIAGMETPPPPPPPGGGGNNTLMLDNIRLEPVELRYGIDPKYPADPAHKYIYDGWVDADTMFIQPYQLATGDGLKTIYTQLMDLAGNISAEPGWTASIILDTQSPNVSITSPQDYSYISGTIGIYGYTWDANLSQWTVSYRAQQDTAWQTLNTDTMAYQYPHAGRFALWNTGSVDDGKYVLRVSAVDKAGNTNADSVIVSVTNGGILPLEAITAEFITFNSLPVDATTSGAGDLFITDTKDNKIWQYSANGDSLLCFGYRSTGQDTIGFNQPVGVAVDDSGFIWVADCYNAKVKKFSPDGALALSFGQHGSNPGQFNQPTGIDADKDYIYLTDKQNNRVQKFTHSGGLVASFGQSTLLQPTGIALRYDQIDSTMTENLYVVDSKHNRIMIYTIDGSTSDSISSLGLNEPWGICFDHNNNAYIADAHNNRVVEIDPWGNKLLAFGNQGTAPGQFKLPQGVTGSPDGKYLYVIDTHNDRVQRFQMVFDAPSGFNLSSRYKPTAKPVSYVFALEQNRPNPFQGSTEIKYQLPKQERVLLNIYNISGQLVKTLVNQTQNAGLFSVKWDGRDAKGRNVSTGVYLLKLGTGERSSTKKLMVLR